MCLQRREMGRWGNVWFKSLPIRAVRASQNWADVITSTTCALIINEKGLRVIYWKQDDTQENSYRRRQWHHAYISSFLLLFSFFPPKQKQCNFLRTKLLSVFGKNRCGYTSQWALQQQLTARQPNKEKQEQQCNLPLSAVVQQSLCTPVWPAALWGPLLPTSGLQSQERSWKRITV